MIKNRTLLFWSYVFFLIFLSVLLFAFGFEIYMLRYTVGFPLFIFIKPFQQESFIILILLFAINSFIQFIFISTFYELARDGFKLKTGID
ncbi:MAG: hypothetical protein KBF42_07545 [Chitinophagales bacterium]|jgi:hypothetical protein|nr:hypothetical protein [Bacteroidota bacterium]MBP8916376.1 hypothetical protein [Chitinophagales bacterium]MBP9221220.1 hypothetical protein [Chitinophagales bacterium]MBP9795087.1 hypothetical protein [Chitinophagales bacterium]